MRHCKRTNNLKLEANGTYVQGNAVPFDVDVDPRSGRVFVSMPAMMNGGAVTLATVEDPAQVQSPRLVPYPDWSWHAGARGCDGLTSVFRIHCDRTGLHPSDADASVTAHFLAIGRFKKSYITDRKETTIPRALNDIFQYKEGTKEQSKGIPPKQCVSKMIARAQVDRCDRLWVIDSGIVDITNTFTRRCPAQLLVFQLRTNKLLVRHRFQTPEASCDEALLLTVATEQLDAQCGNDAYAYVADAGAYALFSLRSWRVASDLFFPDVNAREFSVAGTSMTLMDGVLGLAVSPRVGAACGSHLYFHALTSFQEGRVCTAVLRNASLFADGANNADSAFSFIGRREGQSGAQGSSSSGVLFFNPVNKYSINCWNQRRNYASPNLPAVEQDREVLRFVTGLKVIPGTGKSRPEEVWAISNNAQLLFTGTFRPNVNNTVNIVRGAVPTLLAGVNC
ncbi:Protein yellow [Gryllus bimaculatus]|nr:Protein yellow [Gryllus bimaculatus]